MTREKLWIAQRGDDGKVNSVRIEIWKAICREEGAVEGKGQKGQKARGLIHLGLGGDADELRLWLKMQLVKGG